MAAQADNKAVAFSEKVFEQLLAAYPRAHREEYGAAMAQLFRDQCRDAWNESSGWGLARLWLRVLPDVIGTSLSEHLEAIKERKFMLNRISTLFRSAQSFKFFTVFSAVFLLVVIAVTIVTFILPESFAGTARILVRKVENSANANAGNAQTMSENYDPYFIQTECELMRSQGVLSKVVENLSLNEKWGAKYRTRLTTPETTDLLKRVIDIRPIRNTSLIEIRAYSDKPEEAAELANAVAEVYRDFWLKRNRARAEQGITALKLTVDKQEKELLAALVEVDRLKQELHVSDPEPSSTGPSAVLSMAVVSQLQSDITRSESDAARLEKLLEKLKALPPEKLRATIQTALEPDSVLNTLVNEFDLAEQNLLKMKRSLNEDHPDFKVATHLVDEFNNKINDRVANIMYGLQTRLETAKAHVSYLSEKLAETKQTDIETAARTRPYWEAKRKLVALLQFRAALQMKSASEEADLKLSKVSMVEILDRATPNLTPVRPNKPMNITIGVVLGVVLGLIAGGGVAGISFLSRRNAPPKIAS